MSVKDDETLLYIISIYILMYSSVSLFRTFLTVDLYYPYILIIFEIPWCVSKIITLSIDGRYHELSMDTMLE